MNKACCYAFALLRVGVVHRRRETDVSKREAAPRHHCRGKIMRANRRRQRPQLVGACLEVNSSTRRVDIIDVGSMARAWGTSLNSIHHPFLFRVFSLRAHGRSVANWLCSGMRIVVLGGTLSWTARGAFYCIKAWGTPYTTVQHHLSMRLFGCCWTYIIDAPCSEGATS